MKERLKTLLLCALVVSSILLTWQLWYSPPNYEFSTSDYASVPFIGEERTVQEVAIPADLVFHLGKDRHRQAHPFVPLYENLLRTFSGWNVYELKAVAYGEQLWDEMRREQVGVELRYLDRVQLEWMENSWLSPFLQMENRFFERVWFTLSDNEVVAYFIDDTARQVLKGKVAMAPNEFSRQVFLTLSLPEVSYHELPVFEEDRVIRPGVIRTQGIYLPLEPVRISRHLLTFRPLQEKQLVDLLFVEPDMVRQLASRDGSQLYTDGNRSVQVNRNSQSMVYYAPASAPAPSLGMSRSNPLTQGTQFVNQHGGWSGEYLLASTRESEGSLELTFHPYYGQYPIWTEEIANWGRMRLQMQLNAGISLFERPALVLEDAFLKEEVELMSGEEVMAALIRHPYYQRGIKRVFVAYRLVAGEYLELLPGWVVEDVNGRLSPLQKGGITDGLE